MLSKNCENKALLLNNVMRIKCVYFFLIKKENYCDFSINSYKSFSSPGL